MSGQRVPFIRGVDPEVCGHGQRLGLIQPATLDGRVRSAGYDDDDVDVAADAVVAARRGTCAEDPHDFEPAGAEIAGPHACCFEYVLTLGPFEHGRIQ